MSALHSARFWNNKELALNFIPEVKNCRINLYSLLLGCIKCHNIKYQNILQKEGMNR